MTGLLDTWAMLGRQGRALVRQLIWIAILIVEPIVWITLFRQLFRRVIELPGFETDSYIQFLTPGIVVMAAFFSASWSGWNMLTDLDRGVLERFLATRVSRLAIVVSQVLRSSIIGVAKALLLIAVAHALGARVTAGLAGWLILLLAAALSPACSRASRTRLRSSFAPRTPWSLPSASSRCHSPSSRPA